MANNILFRCPRLRARNAHDIRCPRVRNVHDWCRTIKGATAKTTSLSALNGAGWQNIPNCWGDFASVDFGLSEPFPLFSEQTAVRLREIVRSHFGTAAERSTARTSACLRGAWEVNDILSADACRKELESVATKLVGTPMRMHPVRYEEAHINVQKGIQEGPVDDWHNDSTPFVLVTLLTDHTNDPGGALHVRDASGLVKRSGMRKPGDATLMQGSHVSHLAEQSLIGERLTIVTSFIADSLEVYDSSSPRVSFEYSLPATILQQYMDHALDRLQANATTLPDDDSELTSRRVGVILAEIGKLKHSWCSDISARLSSGRFSAQSEDPLSVFAELIDVSDRLSAVKDHFEARLDRAELAGCVNEIVELSRARRMGAHVFTVPAAGATHSPAKRPESEQWSRASQALPTARWARQSSHTPASSAQSPPRPTPFGPRSP